jgi:Flp pilus assembly protein CpaB
MRRIFLIVGALLAVIVAAGIFMLWTRSRPVVYELPIAATDIPAGTILQRQMFRPVAWSDLDPESVDRFITLEEFEAKAQGKAVLSDIRAGLPILESQVDPNSNAEAESRLSLLISGTKTSYIVIPTSPDEVGNFVQPGDRVDLLLTLGDRPTTDDLYINEDGELLKEDKSKGSSGGGGANQFQPLLAGPIHKLVMQNMRVLRVDREIPRDNSQNQNGDNAEQQRERERLKKVATVQRLYVEVTRDQYEVASFALNDGKRNIAVRASTGDTVIEPSEGVTWNDFIRWFYTQRNKEIQADSFRKVGPYEGAPRE